MTTKFRSDPSAFLLKGAAPARRRDCDTAPLSGRGKAADTASRKGRIMRTLPDVISRIDLPSGPVFVDEHGYLTDPADWSTDFVAHVAQQENLNITPQHLEIISFMRDYLEDHGIAADARFVLKYIAERDGLNKSEAKQVLFALFPYGYVKQACKISGMKQPRAWSTG
jgi:TusE/DsrC/DsvC family sulfur relay protein